MNETDIVTVSLGKWNSLQEELKALRGAVELKDSIKIERLYYGSNSTVEYKGSNEIIEELVALQATSRSEYNELYDRYQKGEIANSNLRDKNRNLKNRKLLERVFNKVEK